MRVNALLGVTVIDGLDSLFSSVEAIESLILLGIREINIKEYVNSLLFREGEQILKPVSLSGSLFDLDLRRQGVDHTAVDVTGKLVDKVGDPRLAQFVCNGLDILEGW